jgi:subtilisin-like proprotein convertase family protein
MQRRKQITENRKAWRPEASSAFCSLLSAFGFLLLAFSSQGAIYTPSQSPNALIPDGNASGISFTMNLSGLQGPIQNLNINLNISGGYNGDLYAYIRHGDSFCVLLNRVGTSGSDPFGYGDTGFNVTLDQHAGQSVDIHNYQDVAGNINLSGQLTGTWRPDGGDLSVFNGMNANGDWTIFFADLSSGEQSTLVSWGLEITTVPEPITWALAIFTGLFVTFRLTRRLHSRSRQTSDIVRTP